jgi:hypothetical protein
MQRAILLFLSCIILASCAEIRASGTRAQQTVEREVALSKDKLDYYFDPDRRVIDKPPQPFPSRYCYKNFGDIVCYKDPLPNAKTRLVGYQEPGNRTDWNDEVGTAPKDPTYDYRMNSTFNPWKNESGTQSVYVKRFPKDAQTAATSEPQVETVSPPVRVYEDNAAMNSPKGESKTYRIKKQPKKQATKKRVKPSRECLVYSDGTTKKKKGKSSSVKSASRKKTEGSASTTATAAPPEKSGAVKPDGMKSDTAKMSGAPSSLSTSSVGTGATGSSAVTPGTATPPTVPDQPKVMVERPANVPAPETVPPMVPVKSVRDLKEIKYDSNIADPKPLLEKQK